MACSPFAYFVVGCKQLEDTLVLASQKELVELWKEDLSLMVTNACCEVPLQIL